MVISAQDYKAKFARTKEVDLGNGIVFEIRLLSPIDMWDDPATAGKEKDASVSSFMKKVLTKGVVSPKIVLEDEEGCVNIRDLSTEHFTKLADEVLVFSGYRTREGGQTDFLSPETKG
jgi:hypothetical protein